MGEQDRGEAILAFVERFSAEHGFSPTVREIGEGVGLKSTSTVHWYLHRLVKQERLTMAPNSPRTLVLRPSR